MIGLLATSARSPAAAPEPGREALSYLDDAGVHHHDDGWVALSAPQPGDEPPAGGRFTVRLTRSVRDRTSDLGTERLASLLGDGSTLDGAALAAILPPFAAAHRAGAGAPVVVAADWLGLRQLYWWQGADAAAVSTSALALVALTGAVLDPAALGAQSLLGWQVGHATPFAGVSKLAPGSVAVLHQGRVRVRQYAEPALPPEPAPVDTVVAEMAGILRELHESCLADHPDTVLQLSGGQDSRLQLCAVPPSLRAGMRAFTLDVHGGAESRVATRLAEMCGLAHEVVWLDERPVPEPATAYRAARDAAVALDAMSSPVAEAPLALVEAGLAQGYRLVGTGGETARGFYYPGQPRGERSPRAVERLADWRLFTNEAVDTAALEPEFAAGAREDALRTLRTCFEGYHADWLRATDEFYLWQRVQRWAGAHDTVSAVRRYSIASLLDRRLMQLALSPPPADKRGSRLTGQLLQRLDPDLARIPLDSGLVPARLAAGGGSVAAARVTATKVTRKVWQRVSRTRRSQLGAAELGELVLAHWRSAPELLDPLRRTGVVRAGWLDGLQAGRHGAAPATVAFLVNLLTAVEAAGGAARRQSVRPGR